MSDVATGARGRAAVADAAAAPPSGPAVGTRRLLALGAAAGPLYIIVGLAQALTRDGFDMRRHALSLLANGDLGWIQVAIFLLAGLLVLAGAVGVRRRLRGGRGGTWGPILLAAWGVGLVGSGIFVADPGGGFPPGSAVAEGAAMSTSGVLHFVAGAIAFYALVAASLVFARRFLARGERGWAAYSLLSGLGFLVVFGMIASGPAGAALMLTFYAAVAWIWVWHSAVLVRLAT